MDHCSCVELHSQFLPSSVHSVLDARRRVRAKYTDLEGMFGLGSITGSYVHHKSLY